MKVYNARDQEAIEGLTCLVRCETSRKFMKPTWFHVRVVRKPPKEARVLRKARLCPSQEANQDDSGGLDAAPRENVSGRSMEKSELRPEIKQIHGNPWMFNVPLCN